MDNVIWTMAAKAVEEKIAELRELHKVDREAAASGADQLRIEVLTVIANGLTTSPRDLAAAVLATVDEDIG
jgi:hypothetical protein